MTIHIAAEVGRIADTVLLPGDPLRARYIAEHFLEQVSCHNEIRAMYGYTGAYKGHPISVQGTGMGIPSISIYATELMQTYGAQTLIRIGTCGAIDKDFPLREVILAKAASTDSSMNRHIFGQADYAPSADFILLKTAYEQGRQRDLPIRVGSVLTSDAFYVDNPDWEKWSRYGVMAVEMETAALYTLAAKFRRRALALLTVSDHILTGEKLTAKQRQQSLNDMIELALETAIAS
ncbi:purine-nucleoside phosphorylase [Heliobacterium undosum]|uniref:Purine nucleoside phosphorylase DeoD-type n=1 Tax=Heliomicrobium undosum TaxID=121734 RepID=A0A845L8P2_9FIRM|nr:purine-nucleoside phosphorylase [Heliomicrobium undosum]MZP31395.1 purine-nucleoside phosphorylase [Heliomicrobium undosum]